MISEKSVKEQKKQIDALQTISFVYGEIAATRMRKIRQSVLENREYLLEIGEIFQDCLLEYSERVRRSRGSKSNKVTFLPHNGQVVSVFISANTGFYGDIIPKTFRLFLSDIRKNKTEVTIIGKLGKLLYLNAEGNHPFTYFELPDYGIDKESLIAALRHLVAYEEIRIYYGKYHTVVTQKPDVYNITSGTPITTNQKPLEEYFIFEPSLEEILKFFESQIFASLFDQILRESQLAKLASRILAMDTASKNIQSEQANLKIDVNRFRHRTLARKQQGALSSVLYR